MRTQILIGALALGSGFAAPLPADGRGREDLWKYDEKQRNEHKEYPKVTDFGSAKRINRDKEDLTSFST